MEPGRAAMPARMELAMPSAASAFRTTRTDGSSAPGSQSPTTASTGVQPAAWAILTVRWSSVSPSSTSRAFGPPMRRPDPAARMSAGITA